ncbi:MAG: hypothetical protein HYV60_19085 [Planctomycetia bacterium]|nr:hypothetical protein [Planctomycetia bacterium]
MVRIPTVEALAERFSQTIHDWLGEETVMEVNRRNRVPEYEGLCATHDFCDPNQAMVDSLNEFGLEFEHELIELINASWSIAQQRGFQRQIYDRD